MSSEPRYYYVDTQNQATGPIAMAGLLALKSAGAIHDATLVAIEGGTDWAAFSTLQTPGSSPTPAAPLPSPSPVQASSSSSTTEPLWASQLSQKIEQLTSAMDKLVVALEKARPATGPVAVPATAALHAEKINLNPTPKPGIAGQNPPTGPATLSRPTPMPMPAGIPAAAPKPAGVPMPAMRPGLATPLAPLSVPANAQKSALPLPALGKSPGPAPTSSPPTAPAKGNIFSKFLKK